MLMEKERKKKKEKTYDSVKKDKNDVAIFEISIIS